MKYILKLIAVITISSAQGYSQNDLTLLQNKDWIYQPTPTYTINPNGGLTPTPTDTNIYKRGFTATKTQLFTNGVFIESSDYYLSTTFIHWDNFDSSKVGSVFNGKYLITPTKTYLIRELTNTKLVLVPFFTYGSGILSLSTTESTYLKN